jgi:chromosome segregation ATPase
MAQRPDPNTTIQQLTVEVANAYKIASDRAEYQIQSINQERQALARQLEQERATSKSLRAESVEFQKQVEQLQAQLGALQLQLDSRSSAPGDNVLSL